MQMSNKLAEICKALFKTIKTNEIDETDEILRLSISLAQSQTYSLCCISFLLNALYACNNLFGLGD